MSYTFKHSLCALTVISGLSFKAAFAYTYIAKKGDTLSDILYQNNIKPIYGKKGMLEKTLNLNPEMRNAKGDRIMPGKKIILVGMPVEESVTAHPAFTEQVEKEKIVESRTVSDIFNQTFFWKLSPVVSWKELTATDSNNVQNSKASILSDMSYGASVVYGMRFHPDLDVYSKIFVESVNFSSDNSIKILKEKVTTSSLAVGAFYKKKWQLEAGMSEELFLTSPDTTSVDIKKVSLPEVKAIFSDELYQFQEATLGYSLSGRGLLPRKAPGIDPAFSYGTGAGIEAKLRNQSFYLGYEQSFLKADSNSTDSKNIFWRYTWETP